MSPLTTDSVPRKRLILPLRTSVLTRLHLDVEQGLDRGLDLRLGRVRGDLEDHLVVLRQRMVDRSVMTGETITS